MGKSRAHGGARIRRLPASAVQPMSRGLRSRARRYGAMAGVLLVGAALLATLAAWLVLRASLPVLDGRAARSGVHASVRVNRDVDGVPSITAQNRGDLAFALGYLHAQDRFFQMDLLRRAAAGELAALLGPSLLPSDRELRRHRFRDVAARAVAGLDAPSLAVLDAYAERRKCRTRALRSRPFEYWVLGVGPSRGPPRTPCCACMRCSCSCRILPVTASCSADCCVRRSRKAVWRFIEAGATRVGGGDRRKPERAARQFPTAEEIDLRELAGLPVRPPGAGVASSSIRWAATTGRSRDRRTANGAAIDCQRHASGVPGAEHLVSGVRLRQMGDGAGFDEVGRHAARHTDHRRGKQRAHRLGFHQQLRTSIPGWFGWCRCAAIPMLMRRPKDITSCGTSMRSIAVKGAPTEHLESP